MQVNAILFDNDGTLVDTHDLILLSMRHATSAVLGRVVPDERLMAKVGIPLADQMEEFAEGDASLRDELLRVYREHNHAIHDEMVTLFPGVADGLAGLHAMGLKMGVVTSKRHALAQHGLEVLDVWDYMGFLVGADDCERGKPAPDPVILGAQLAGADPAECLYVGDSPFDIRAAKAAGCPVAAALWGMFPESVLKAEQPDFLCATFADLVQLVGRISGKDRA